MRARIVFLCGALVLAACGQQNADEPSSAPPPPSEMSEALAAPPVDSALLAVPNTAFAAIEPTEIGIIGAPTVEDAIAPLTVDTHEENGSLQVSLQETDDNAVADVVRLGLADDSVAGAHLRIEFRREPDGWYPTNAYRRFQRARGDVAGQWSVTPCP
ncbi:MAG: hypothetical protein NW206_05775 [Hyphomonadaceae bacterium]|nr:hypothetical protein [Hyphomonadaceae bacterium]